MFVTAFHYLGWWAFSCFGSHVTPPGDVGYLGCAHLFGAALSRSDCERVAALRSWRCMANRILHTSDHVRCLKFFILKLGDQINTNQNARVLFKLWAPGATSGARARHELARRRKSDMREVLDTSLSISLKHVRMHSLSRLTSLCCQCARVDGNCRF